MDSNIKEAASSFFISVGAILVVFFVIYAGVAHPWEAMWSSMWTSLGWTEAIGPQGAGGDGPVTIDDGPVPLGETPGESAGISAVAVALELSGILLGVALAKVGAVLRRGDESGDGSSGVKGLNVTISAI
ncbi:MAG: hypothetical protein LBU86_02550 [Oscillospiraceae bacterium]|nr:hypothetical protein [Oscillospiraceae bacterium]